MLNNKKSTIRIFNIMIFASGRSRRKLNFYWSVQPIYSLVMLFGTLLCLCLGVWQFNKSKNFQDVDVTTVELQGRYLSEPHFLLDNRTHKGKAGYHLYSIFETEKSKKLINRGFIGVSNRLDIPEFDTPKDHVKISGIQKLPSTPLILKNVWGSKIDSPDMEKFSNTVYRVQQISINSILQQTGIELEERIFQLIEGEGIQIAVEESEPYMNKHKHMAYAVQWWLLSIAAVVIWLVSSLKRKSNSSWSRGEV